MSQRTFVKIKFTLEANVGCSCGYIRLVVRNRSLFLFNLAGLSKEV
jgi:hypothetical protein